MKSEFSNPSLGWENQDSLNDDSTDELLFTTEEQFRCPDDSLPDPHVERQLSHLMDTITRVGGEVCRLRAEVDGLLDQNQDLRTSFNRLRDVIAEKGQLNMDDFELACDVVQASMNESGAYHKKVAN